MVFTLDIVDFTFDNMEFTLDNMTPVLQVRYCVDTFSYSSPSGILGSDRKLNTA